MIMIVARCQFLSTWGFSTFANPIIHRVYSPKILHNDCVQFLLGHEDDPREIENNAYANFWGGKRGVLWDLRK